MTTLMIVNIICKILNSKGVIIIKSTFYIYVQLYRDKIAFF